MTPYAILGRLLISVQVWDSSGPEIMSAIWQFIKKYEFWVLVAIWAGLVIAAEITGDTLFDSLSFLTFMIAVTRLDMHPMWKKDEHEDSGGM